MLELGEASDEGHRVVGEAAARTVDWLVVVGAGAARDRRGRRPRPASPARHRPGARRRGRARRPARRACATATSCWSRRRAGSPSTRVVDGLRARARPSARPAMTVELIQGLLLAFALMVILMSPYIRLLHALGLRQAHPPGGPGEPLHQGGHADDGRPPDRRRRHRHLLLPAAGAGRLDLRAARRPGRRRRAGRLRRLPQRPDGGGDPGPPEAHLADRRRVRRGLADPADLRHHGHRRCRSSARSRSTRGSTCCSGRSPSSPPPTA